MCQVKCIFKVNFLLQCSKSISICQLLPDWKFESKKLRVTGKFLKILKCYRVSENKFCKSRSSNVWALKVQALDLEHGVVSSESWNSGGWWWWCPFLILCRYLSQESACIRKYSLRVCVGTDLGGAALFLIPWW